MNRTGVLAVTHYVHIVCPKNMIAWIHVEELKMYFDEGLMYIASKCL